MFLVQGEKREEIERKRENSKESMKRGRMIYGEPMAGNRMGDESTAI